MLFPSSSMLASNYFLRSDDLDDELPEVGVEQSGMLEAVAAEASIPSEVAPVPTAPKTSAGASPKAKEAHSPSGEPSASQPAAASQRPHDRISAVQRLMRGTASQRIVDRRSPTASRHFRSSSFIGGSKASEWPTSHKRRTSNQQCTSRNEYSDWHQQGQAERGWCQCGFWKWRTFAW